MKYFYFKIATLLIALSFLTLSTAEAKKRKPNNKQYFFTYNQLVSLPSKLRKSYLIQLQNFISELKTHEKKKYSALIWSLVNRAYAEENNKICMNYGWFKEEKDCDANFAITKSLMDTFNGTDWEGKLNCSKDGESVCNPVLYGPGVCANGNNTNLCTQSAQQMKDPNKGTTALNSTLEDCQSKSNLADKKQKLCSMLESGYNNIYIMVNRICRLPARDDSYPAICQRAAKAMTLATARAKRSGVIVPRPESTQTGDKGCHFVSEPTFITLSRQDIKSISSCTDNLSHAANLCVGTVSGCDQSNKSQSIFCFTTERACNSQSAPSCYDKFIKTRSGPSSPVKKTNSTSI